MSTSPTTPSSSLHPLAEKWGWLLFLGICLVLLGIFALQQTFLVTVIMVELFGILLIAGGAIYMVHAFFNRRWSGLFLEILVGLLYLGAGLCITFNPIGGAAILTLFIGFGILFNGVLRIVLALTHRGFPAWPIVFLGGLVSVALGIMIVARWPESSFIIIGLFVAIELIFAGASWIALALAARRLKSMTPAT